MNNRIKEVRTSLKLSQAEFGERIKLSQNYIWMLEKGERTPSDRTINDICREFKINEAWLRTGIGAPRAALSKEDQITLVLGKAINGTSTARDRLIRALARLPDDAFPLIEKFILETAEKLKEESTEAE